MLRKKFSLEDITRQSKVSEGHYDIDGRKIGLRIEIPKPLHDQFPFKQNAYDFLQFLREPIFEYGLIEIPDLAVNLCNYTLAQKDPSEHHYSQNPYLTGRCQAPHQDTPPYPTAFWLGEARQYSATWVMSESFCQQFYQFQASHRQLSLDQIHQALVARSIENKQALLLNQEPGLLLIDNSHHQNLYHARTTKLDHFDNFCKLRQDSPMYAFNEVGLLNYIDQLDEQRGQENRCEQNKEAVSAFMQQEK